MADVFLSYAREDRVKAEIVAGVLSRAGWTVWWDRTIPPGRTFDDVLEDALDDARCVVVLWSQTSVGSHWVKAEAAEGARREILVPALIEDVRIPLEFRRVQAADLRDWNGEPRHAEFEKFVHAIWTLAPLGGGTPAQPRAAAAAATPPPAPERPARATFDTFDQPAAPEPRVERQVARRESSQTGWLVGALVVVAAAAIGFWWQYIRPESIATPEIVAHAPPETKPAVTRVSVPSVIGNSIDAATLRLQQAGLSVGTTTFRQTGPRGEIGSVVAQKPGPDELADSGSRVDLVVTRLQNPSPLRGRPGAPALNVEVPALLGLTLEMAQDRLGRRDLTVGRIDHRADDDFPPETVVAQDPAPSSKQAPGTAVSLVLAERAGVAVPVLIGLPLEKARAALTSAGLQLGNVTRRSDGSAKDELVSGQTPRGGAKLEKGQRVDLEVAQPASPTGRRPAANTVIGFRVRNPSPAELAVEFDFSYDGKLGTERIYLQVCPKDADGREVSGIACAREALKVGANHLSMTMKMQDNTRTAATASVEACLVGPASLNCQVFPFAKRWGRPDKNPD